MRFFISQTFMYCLLMEMLWIRASLTRELMKTFVAVAFNPRISCRDVFDIFHWRKYILTYIWANKQFVNSVLPPCFWELKRNTCPVCRRCRCKKFPLLSSHNLWKFSILWNCFFALSEFYLSAVRILCEGYAKSRKHKQRANQIVIAGQQLKISSIHSGLSYLSRKWLRINISEQSC